MLTNEDVLLLLLYILLEYNIQHAQLQILFTSVPASNAIMTSCHFRTSIYTSLALLSTLTNIPTFRL